MTKRVYVCSKLRATADKTQEEHIEDARFYSNYVMKTVGASFTPHLLYSQHWNIDKHSEWAMYFTYSMSYLEVCDEVHVFIDETKYISGDMVREIGHAYLDRIPIQFYVMQDGKPVRLDTSVESQIVFKIIRSGVIDRGGYYVNGTIVL